VKHAYPICFCIYIFLQVHASHWASTLQTLYQHSIHSKALNWCLPDLVDIPDHHHHHQAKHGYEEEEEEEEKEKLSVKLSVKNLVPYWIDGTGRLGEPVANSLSMNIGEMILLTVRVYISISSKKYLHSPPPLFSLKK
jgi:hypothetical protein